MPQSAASPDHPIAVLDGWRGISILCVLAAHLLPLGPSRFHLNSSVANLGMVMFFTLSGYLITSTLLHRPNVTDFLIRRLCRIVPLAWLYLLFALPLTGAPLAHYPPMFFFYGNLPHFTFDPIDAPFWSLCVEMQFYLFVALIAALFPRRWPLLLPVAALSVTLARILSHTGISIVTWLRADEILAGGILALLLAHRRSSDDPANPAANALTSRATTAPFSVLLFSLVLLLLFLACQSRSGPLQFLRPYLSATMIGLTLLAPRHSFYTLLRTRLLRFIASISYSLYVLHSTMMVGWFDPVSKVLKYERRALGFPILFFFGWISTRFWESHWIAFGKSLIRRRHPIA